MTPTHCIIHTSTMLCGAFVHVQKRNHSPCSCVNVFIYLFIYLSYSIYFFSYFFFLFFFIRLLLFFCCVAFVVFHNNCTWNAFVWTFSVGHAHASFVDKNSRGKSCHFVHIAWNKLYIWMLIEWNEMKKKTTLRCIRFMFSFQLVQKQSI